VAASWLLVGTLDFALCSDPEALTAYVGLAPVPRESSRRVRSRPHSDHDGTARPRTALSRATLSAARCNPAIAAFSRRRRASDKPPAVALRRRAHAAPPGLGARRQAPALRSGSPPTTTQSLAPVGRLTDEYRI